MSSSEPRFLERRQARPRDVLPAPFPVVPAACPLPRNFCSWRSWWWPRLLAFALPPGSSLPFQLENRQSERTPSLGHEGVAELGSLGLKVHSPPAAPPHAGRPAVPGAPGAPGLLPLCATFTPRDARCSAVALGLVLLARTVRRSPRCHSRSLASCVESPPARSRHLANRMAQRCSLMRLS